MVQLGRISFVSLIVTFAIGLMGTFAENSAAEDLGTVGRTTGQYDAMMANRWKHMVRGTTAALAEPKTAADLAAFTRNYYTALIDRGFSKDEALTLVGRLSFPVGGGRAASAE